MAEGDLAPEEAAWLVSSDGLSALDAAVDALDASDDPLALGTRLREEGHPPARAAAVMSAATARLRWRHVLPERLVLTRTAAEQASHPTVAAWRARRYADRGVVVDLCCGVGIDAIALGRAAGSVVAVDRDPGRVVLAEHNLRVSAVEGRAIVGDALRPPVAIDGATHADPSRRRGLRRLRRLGEYEPPVPALVEVLRPAGGYGIVVSPAVDLRDPGLPEGTELEFVQVGDELIETVVWSGDLRRPGGTLATATLLPSELSISRSEEPAHRPVAPPGDWLVEFAPAAVRARVHEQLAAEIDARRLAERRALFTATREPPPGPWYDASPIQAVLPARGRALRGWLAARGTTEVEFVVHGLDVDLASLWRDAGRPARGPHGLRAHLIRLDEGAVTVITGQPTAERTRDMT